MATMYWMQWSRSAGLWSGPFLSMMRMADSWVTISTFLISRMRSLTSGWSKIGRFDRRLRMELGGKRDLEEHVLHDVRAVVR